MGAAFVAAYGGYMALAGAAVSAATTYTSVQQQKEQQKAYNKSLEKEAIRQYQELDKVEADAIQESHAESLQAQKDYLEARSSIELQAAATGTYGNSIDLAIQDLKTGFGGRMAEITYNREAKLDQVDRQAQSSRTQSGLGADRSIQAPAFYSAFASGLGTYNTLSGMSDRVGAANKAGAKAQV